VHAAVVGKGVGEQRVDVTRLSEYRLQQLRGPNAVGRTIRRVLVEHQAEAFRDLERNLGNDPPDIGERLVQDARHQFEEIIASSLEKFAVEIRHLQRTEVQEAEEPFTQGQKGSSAMPHKRNPILSENVSGLARLMRSYAMAAMEKALRATFPMGRAAEADEVARVVFFCTTDMAAFMTGSNVLVDGGLTTR